MTKRYIPAALALMVAPLATGCGSADTLEEVTASTQQALSEPNFRMPQNGLNPGAVDPNGALLSNVAVWPLNDWGFATAVSADPNIPSLFNTGKPTSAEHLMKEIVSCALNPQQKVTATVNNISYTWEGEFGLCSSRVGQYDDWSGNGNGQGWGEWCWEIVSACVLARMNALSKHVPVSLRIPYVNPVRPEFLPVAKVRVRTILRDGTEVGSGWQPEFVGICKRGDEVTLERNGATKVRVCKGIHGCDNTKQQFPSALDSPHFYAGFVQEFAAGSGPITFTCPTDVGTAPNGKPDYAYFSIMVTPPIEDPIAASPPGASFTYPAMEQEVFTYPEGAFYGNIFPVPGMVTDRWACHSKIWQASKAYFTDRLCVDPSPDPNKPCFLSTAPLACEEVCTGRTPAPENAYYNCEQNLQYISAITVFLNEPSAISSDPVASAIVSTHDECTPGAPLVDGSSPIVTIVCDADPYCCELAWDSSCVEKVQSVAKSFMCGPTPCSHSVCATGAALTNGCSSVVTSVCTADPSCCSTAWNDTCVAEAQSVENGQACPCSHSVCTTGAALMNGCSPVVTSVCAEDPNCCNTAWDDICVKEIKKVAHSKECHHLKK